MYNPLISVGVGLVVAVLLSFVLGGVFYGIVPGVLVSIGVFIWLSRKAYAQMSDAVQKAQLARLRAAIAEGMADHAAGRYTELVTDDDFKAFAAEIKRAGRARLKAAK